MKLYFYVGHPTKLHRKLTKMKLVFIFWGKWKTRKAGTGTGTETETEIRKRSSDLKVSIVRVDGNSMQVCW